MPERNDGMAVRFLSLRMCCIRLTRCERRMTPTIKGGAEETDREYLGSSPAGGAGLDRQLRAPGLPVLLSGRFCG